MWIAGTILLCLFVLCALLFVLVGVTEGPSDTAMVLLGCAVVLAIASAALGFAGRITGVW